MGHAGGTVWERAHFSLDLRKGRCTGPLFQRQPPNVTGWGAGGLTRLQAGGDSLPAFSFAIQKKINKWQKAPSAVEKLERLVLKNPLWRFGDNYKKAELVTVVSGETSVLGDRQRDIFIVQGQPVASGRLALSCCDNRITSPTSRQHQQMAASSYRSHLSLQPCIHPQMLWLKWRSGAQRAGVTLKRGRRDVGPPSWIPSEITDGPGSLQAQPEAWAG